VNLAVGLAQLWNDSAILMDLCMVMGQDALMLNLQMRHTWANLNNIPPDEIDLNLLEKLLLQHTSGVRVLASPAHPEEGEALTVDTVNAVLKLFKAHYNYIVIDLPHDLRDTTLAGLDNADEIIVLLAPEMASVRATTETLSLFNQLHYPREKIHLALNWTFPKLGLARKTIEKVLPQPIEIVIPYATEEMIRAINWGNPVMIEQPDNPMSALLEDYAFELSQTEHKTKLPPVLSEALQRVFKRKQLRQAASR
jgi:pilus assembly protein CpaE